MKLSRFFRSLAAPASLEVPNPAGDYASPDAMGYVPRPHVAVTGIDEQTGLQMSAVRLTTPGSPYSEG